MKSRQHQTPITAFGETKGAWDWAEDTRAVVSASVIYGRINTCGWSAEAAITTPLKRRWLRNGEKTRAHPLYATWQSMIMRCENPNANSYKNYGGRGIAVCNRWRHSFENFVADMGERSDGMSIDRIDNDGNYEPNNCRWATNQQQVWNSRKSRMLAAFGEQKPIREWARDPRCSIESCSLVKRLKKGMSPEQAIALPRQGRGGSPSKARVA